MVVRKSEVLILAVLLAQSMPVIADSFRCGNSVAKVIDFQSLTHFEAVNLGHHNVQENQVRKQLLRET